MMNKLIKSFGWAMNGLRTVWREELSFRIELVIGLVLVVGAGILRFSIIEWVILLGCIGAVLSAEIVNTAIEDICNKIEPSFDPVIGKIKDTMAGYVLFTVVVTSIIGILLLINHF
ncbi:MAG: Undecaprenol kinase [Candidatus Azambacteria bacterium GW2011_GWA1_44_9]|uniref:Undecaprenol kinase n=2 Tax=Parcubacteria group TaxID=1794811 RepID=A0A0G1NBZ0_9BACT|nr:MAG: Undecaprenol kinase [Candidatus Azambacteria bacterium GW2011_GWA1_44_9]